MIQLSMSCAQLRIDDFKVTDSDKYITDVRILEHNQFLNSKLNDVQKNLRENSSVYFATQRTIT